MNSVIVPPYHPRPQFLSKYPFPKLISLAGLRWECFSKSEIDTLSQIEIEIQVNINKSISIVSLVGLRLGVLLNYVQKAFL